MSTPKDGGPAFPLESENDHRYSAGMSLRDYFAAKAGDYLVVAMLNNYGWGVEPIAVATVRYQIADAMLAEREKDYAK